MRSLLRGFSPRAPDPGAPPCIDVRQAGRRGIAVQPIAQYEPAEFRRLAAKALAEAAAGRITPVIGQTFPLERAADAHAAMEGRSPIAKTLLLT